MKTKIEIFNGGNTPEEYAFQCLVAVNQNGSALQSVNPEYLPQGGQEYGEICLAAVKKISSTLKYINPEYLPQGGKEYGEICQAAVKQFSSTLKYVKPEYFLQDGQEYAKICQAAVNKLDSTLKYVKPEYLPQGGREYGQICLATVNKDCSVIKYVNPEYLPQGGKEYGEICLAAVKNGLKLEYVNPKYLPESGEEYFEICLAAILRDHLALQYVNPEYFPAGGQAYTKICLVAVSKSGFASLALEYVKPEHLPESGQDYGKICLAAVNKSGLAFPYVRPEHLPQDGQEYLEICLAAVNEDRGALQYVKPEHLSQGGQKYLEICLAAVNKHASALQLVNLKYLPEGGQAYGEICLAAVNKNALALQDVNLKYLPESGQAYGEICLTAVNNYGFTLQYVRPEHLTQDGREYLEICLATVNKHNFTLQYVNPEYLPQGGQEYLEICLAAVNKHASALQLVNLKYLPEGAYGEICLAAAREHRVALQYVNPEYLPQGAQEYIKICLAAYENDVYSLRDFPEDILKKIANDKNIAIEIIRHNYPQAYDKLHPYNWELSDLCSKQLIQPCTTIILQPETEDGELEDIGDIYAVKKGKENSLWVRTPEALSNLLDMIEEQDKNSKINIALVGHASLRADYIAHMTPEEIAILAYKYPCIQNIVFLGCKTAASEENEYLSVEEENKGKLEQSINETAEQLEITYPFLTKEAHRLYCLARDIVVGTANTPCGIAVVKGPIELENLRLPDELDTAYLFTKTDEHYSLYYIQRTLEGIIHRCITSQLSQVQLEGLKNLALTSMQRKIIDRVAIVDRNGNAVYNKNGEPKFRHVVEKNRVNLFHIEPTHVPFWMKNKKGKIGAVSKDKLDEMKSFIPHSRIRPFIERPYEKTPDKPCYAKKTTIQYESDNFILIENSLIGRTCKAYKNLSDHLTAKVTFWGTRGLLTPFSSINTQGTGRLNITKNSEPWKNESLSSYRFFNTRTNNIDTTKLKEEQNKLLIEGRVKMVGVM
ncbi:hypothetical protein FOG18_10305 [Legionella israelensis]|uniref:DUF4116 domain-containing protein n=1 Tax=Legionella israelensis TaxID=454 RepID=UPI0011815FB2|nr:DUF4116 domain-containing protein [Legionella israelensis]QDP72925.1 hypothetical protein FOG18_10305 [Legionella israelensis]